MSKKIIKTTVVTLKTDEKQKRNIIRFANKYANRNVSQFLRDAINFYILSKDGK